MRGVTLCLVVLAVLATATGTAVGTGNTPPLPAAGVDQTVTPGTTVYLDASGSTDPDGEITSVAWTIETPGDANRTPACGSCRQTHFEATTVGEYAVTLSVTDDDGATRADTLYVTVESEDGPDVSLSGPSTVAPGDGATYTATVSSADTSLDSLSWVVDGEVVARNNVSGANASGSFSTSFGTTDNVSVTAVAYDTLGYRGSTSRTIAVESDGGGGGGDDDDTCDPTYQFCSDADARIQGPGGDVVLIDSNGEPGIQTYVDGELVTIDNPTSSDGISLETTATGAERLVLDDDTTYSDAIDDTRTAETIERRSENKNDDTSDDASNGDSGNGEETGDPPPFRDNDGNDEGDGGSPFGGGSGNNGGGSGGGKGGGKGGRKF